MLDDDGCEMCDGRGEADITTIEEYGCIPCPECVGRELRSRIAELEADQRETLRAVLHHFGPDGAKLVTDHALRARKTKS